jgi:hypothetical protein
LHYSNRHGSGDAFLNEPSSHSISHLAYWIKDTPREQIINDFIKDYIYIKEGSKIHEKDMLFLWRDYLKNVNKLNVFQRNSDFYALITKNMPLFDSQYINCTSMFLPYVYQFKDFWEKYMYLDKSESYFEISEILKLFIETYKGNMEEQTIVELIQYYYPETSIVDNKINKMGCTLWNKKKEIDIFLTHKCNIDSNELYALYCKEFTNKKIVSKLYFQQYLLDTMQNS